MVDEPRSLSASSELIAKLPEEEQRKEFFWFLRWINLNVESARLGEKGKVDSDGELDREIASNFS